MIIHLLYLEHLMKKHMLGLVCIVSLSSQSFFAIDFSSLSQAAGILNAGKTAWSFAKPVGSWMWPYVQKYSIPSLPTIGCCAYIAYLKVKMNMHSRQIAELEKMTNLRFDRVDNRLIALQHDVTDVKRICKGTKNTLNRVNAKVDGIARDQKITLSEMHEVKQRIKNLEGLVRLGLKKIHVSEQEADQATSPIMPFGVTPEWEKSFQRRYRPCIK